MGYKRTTRSGNNGTRTTYTQSFKGPKRSSKMSQSTGGKTSRVTTTTNLNTGERKTYVTQRTSDGWVTRKSLSSPKPKPVKFKKPKKIRIKKSKPMKLSTIGWIMLAIIILSLINS